MEEAQKQAKFEGWGIVEMMGHQREVGFVTTENYGAASLFRVDTPALPERETVLKRPAYAKSSEGIEWCPVGAKVLRSAAPAKSRLVGVGSIYAITPCTEETAMEALESLIERPLILLERPREIQKVLLPGESDSQDEFDTEEGV